eukprot:CAMPEP_0119337606 /NCGR_PEP_ID=MMETSP1333-20130426/94351_1 /TAXON_ID=418940 /ORGANISM="Scyphosphaera apsteinii, Strain RCC1455" /LENGTH=38 /DNA_ID= /DNA_START= /DNA_END= /DNA_ORIENTATION=
MAKVVTSAHASNEWPAAITAAQLHFELRPLFRVAGPAA